MSPSVPLIEQHVFFGLAGRHLVLAPSRIGTQKGVRVVRGIHQSLVQGQGLFHLLEILLLLVLDHLVWGQAQGLISHTWEIRLVTTLSWTSFFTYLDQKVNYLLSIAAFEFRLPLRKVFGSETLIFGKIVKYELFEGPLIQDSECIVKFSLQMHELFFGGLKPENYFFSQSFYQE